jgi:hypothetical protein
LTPRKLLKTLLFLIFFPFIFVALALVFVVKTLERWSEIDVEDDDF